MASPASMERSNVSRTCRSAELPRPDLLPDGSMSSQLELKPYLGQIMFAGEEDTHVRSAAHSCEALLTTSTCLKVPGPFCQPHPGLCGWKQCPSPWCAPAQGGRDQARRTRVHGKDESRAPPGLGAFSRRYYKSWRCLYVTFHLGISHIF